MNAEQLLHLLIEIAINANPIQRMALMLSNADDKKDVDALICSIECISQRIGYMVDLAKFGLHMRPYWEMQSNGIVRHLFMTRRLTNERQNHADALLFSGSCCKPATTLGFEVWKRGVYAQCPAKEN